MVDAPWGPAICQKLKPMGSYLSSSDSVGSGIQPEDFIGRVFYDTCVYDPSATHLLFPKENRVDLDAIASSDFDIYGLPMHVDALTMFCRADLCGDPAEMDAFREGTGGKELAVPETWEPTTIDGTAYLMAGRYHDEYARVGEGRWLFSKVRLDVEFLTPYDRGWAESPLPVDWTW